MRRQRWQHLDRDLKLRIPPPESVPAEPEPSAPPPRSPVPPVTLTSARGYFLLRHYHACIEALEGVDVDHDPEGSRLLGLALGCVSDPRAPGVLQRAVELAPNNVELRAAHLSALMRAGNLPKELERNPRGSMAELVAAALWLRGRDELQSGNGSAAATSFTRAAALFARESPTEVRSARASAGYIAAAASHLLAGDSDAAQNAFAALLSEASPELRTFANTLHAVGEELRGCDEAERREALQPLVELVTSTQLHVAFYGSPGPVDLQWSGSDLAALTAYRRQGG